MDTAPVDSRLSASAALLGAAPHASTDREDRARASTDRSGYVSPSLPVGVVYAESVDDVVDTLRRATELGVPVVPRGAGTGLPVVPRPGPARWSWTCRG
ncbi:FAD-binding protein [Arthrobacter sp. JSM 101049]|uniref:FAD-binding protein n=1 Tax=Arthrobacter sp. JSM 101049 TaxID=929097 RepID=UPI0035644474